MTFVNKPLFRDIEESMMTNETAARSTSEPGGLSPRTEAPGPDVSQFSGWSRRSFLGVLAVIAGGTVAGCSMSGGGGDRQAIGAPNPQRGRKPRAVAATADPPAGYVPTVPFALTSQCVLSEDYFQVANHKIDPAKDTVIAYSRTDGQVEAMVLQGGVVKQVYRDPTQAGGWAVYDLPDATGVTSMVAGMSAPVVLGKAAAAVLKVFYVKESSPDELTVAVETTPPSAGVAPSFTTITDTAPVDWHKDAGPLQIALNADNSLLVSALVAPSVVYKPASDARLYYYADANTVDHDSTTPTPTSWGYLTGFDYVPTGLGWAAMVTRAWSDSNKPMIYLYLPGGSQFPVKGVSPTVLVFSAPLQSGQRTGTVLTDTTAQPGHAVPPPAASTQVVAIEFLTALGSMLMPTALVWTKTTAGFGPRLWALSFDITAGSNKWSWTELVLPAGTSDGLNTVTVSTALTPSPDSTANTVGAASLLDVFVLAGDMLYVFRQAASGDAYKNAARPVYCPAIPLQPGVAAMTSQTGVSDGNELLLAGTDGTLQTLEKDPVSGRWTDTVLHLPATELQQVSSYRVTLTLADIAWNAAVTGQQVSITASTPAMAMIEGPSPQAVLLGPDPVTVRTDSTGEVSIALLADGLSAPTLTLITDGVPDPVTVYPSGPVNTYMQGDGSRLNYLPTMSPGTLTTAKTPDGQTVAPGAAKPADAADAFSTMSQAAILGAQGAKNGLVSSTVARLDASRPRAASKTGAPGKQRRGARTSLSVTAQTSSIDHWAHDVLHAIKKGAVAVSKITIVAEAFTLVTDLVHWAENAVTVVVHGIEDAAHVLHAAFAKLAAAVVHAVKWLEAETIGLLRDSATVSGEFATLIAQCTNFAGDQAAATKRAVDAWLQKEQDDLRKRFDIIRAGYAKGVTLGNIADNKPVKLGSSRRRARLARRLPPPTPALRAADDDQSQPHGNWFYNKIKHGVFGDLDVTGLDGFDPTLTDLRTGFDGAIGDFEKACTSFWTFIKTSITHPSEFDTVGVPALLETISDLLDGAITLARAVIDALFDLITAMSKIIGDMLTTPLSQMGIAGKLLKLAGLGNIHIGAVVNMLLAFPTTLAFKIAHGGDTRPFRQLSGLRAGAGDDTAVKDVRFTASAVMGAWSGLNWVGLMWPSNPPMFFAAVELVGPILFGALAPPTVDENGLPAWTRLSNDNSTLYMSWFTDLVPAFLYASAIYVEHQAGAGHGNKQAAESWEQSVHWLQTMCGAVSLVAGMIGADQDPDAKGKDYALPILLNLPNIGAFFKTAAFQETSLGVSGVIYGVLDLFGGVAAAAVYNTD